MSTARSAFTDAIEDHLALKKQNASLEQAMPIARYDVGDPLDRYPGGHGRANDAGTMVISEDVGGDAAEHAASSGDAQGETSVVDAAGAQGAGSSEPSEFQVGPSPEQAMEAATSIEPGFGGINLKARQVAGKAFACGLFVIGQYKNAHKAPVVFSGLIFGTQNQHTLFILAGMKARAFFSVPSGGQDCAEAGEVSDLRSVYVRDSLSGMGGAAHAQDADEKQQ